ncbi:surface carbohydrate biosynthesis protein [Mesotoga sp. H07.pep.5.3]|uniref:surface carbohydrate biosynthesis protein n=1 Tax=Mesotoga sp. H07.pep.5.3 TaxID=1421003 RepID=UPI000C1A7FB7|nr:surface carbohydrate biosynthesis protein [Mesotoga sp. H07.pep.5.3]PIJ63019.1 hypothetical protein V513_02660 [Mesotoga sp. H07.pep.5.3]
MRMIDIHAFYEHKVREFDSLVLLATYLRSEGLSVSIADLNYSRRSLILKSKPSIAILPFLYSLNTVQSYGINYESLYGYTPTYINLHWEQLGSENSSNFLDPTDDFAKNAFHVSWSKDFSSRLEGAGAKREHIWLTGNPRADLLTDKFTETYISKRSLLKELKIPEVKRIALFIMSFNAAYWSKEKIQNLANEHEFPKAEQFSRISKKALKETIEIVRNLSKPLHEKEMYIILRPHPATPIDSIKEMVKDCRNIRVSRKFPLNQVIFNSDLVMSWISTGTIDSYVFGKPTLILRPSSVPKEFDIPFLRGFQFAKTYRDVLDNLDTLAFNAQILDEFAERIYGFLDGYNCLRIVSKIGDLLKTDSFKMPEVISKKHFANESLKFVIKDIPRSILKKCLPSLLPGRLRSISDDSYSKKEEDLYVEKYSILVENMVQSWKLYSASEKSEG